MKLLIIIFVSFYFLTPLYAQWQSIFLFDAGGFYYASSELEKPDNLMDIGQFGVNLTSAAYQDDDSGKILIQTSGDRILVLARENGYSGEGEFLTLSLIDDVELDIENLTLN